MIGLCVRSKAIVSCSEKILFAKCRTVAGIRTREKVVESHGCILNEQHTYKHAFGRGIVSLRTERIYSSLLELLTMCICTCLGLSLTGIFVIRPSRDSMTLNIFRH